MCSKVLNGHIILTDTSITTILAPEMTYTPLTIYEEEQYEDYDWKVYISNGVDFKGQKVEIQLLNEPQINLTINKTLTDGAVI